MSTKSTLLMLWQNSVCLVCCFFFFSNLTSTSDKFSWLPTLQASSESATSSQPFSHPCHAPMLFLSIISPVFFNFAPQWSRLSASPRTLTGERWQILQLKMSANPALHITLLKVTVIPVQQNQHWKRFACKSVNIVQSHLVDMLSQETTLYTSSWTICMLFLQQTAAGNRSIFTSP